MKRLLILAVFLLAGCGLVDPMARRDVGIDWSSRPADFPQDLKIVIKGTTQKEVFDSPCQHEVLPAPLMILEGCAQVNFDKHECYVWVDQDTDPDYYARLWRHEVLGHCHGYDHPGESSMAAAWLDWKARHPK